MKKTTVKSEDLYSGSKISWTKIGYAIIFHLISIAKTLKIILNVTVIQIAFTS